jgi:hypothetical protein
LAVLVSFELPPALLGEKTYTTQTETVPPTGYLLVTVDLNNETILSQPLGGVPVDISESIPVGPTIHTRTNVTGQVELRLAPGQYGISVTDPRFGLATSAPVYSNNITMLQVEVNRTSMTSLFTAAQEASTDGEVETWDQVVVEVTPYPILLPGVSFLPGSSILVANGDGLPPFKGFPGEVFLQTVTFLSGFSQGQTAYGTEVPAEVVSQVDRSGAYWLTLQPLVLLSLSGITLLQVVSYAAGSSITFANP